MGAASGMVGREAERAQIEHALDQALGGPVGLCLEGAPGVGKTTLWREAIHAAQERGYRVLVTAPAEPDSSLSFAGLGDLVGGVQDVVAELPAPQCRALMAALLLDEASGMTALEALPRAVLTVIRRLAVERPLVVAVDDEQWLDPASARVLAFALCRLRDEPVCVLLARRPADSVLWPELERSYGDAGLSALVLRPLSADEVGRLIEAQVGRPVMRWLQERIYAVSGGNPLYALAIADELESRPDVGSADVALLIPGSLAAAIGNRLAQLEPRAADPLLVVASVSRPTVAVIQAVLSDFTLGDLDSAEQADIVTVTAEGVLFTHPLLAATHYANARPARRREIHRLLARVLENEEECAYHLARGADAPDARIAAQIDAAAQAAAGRGAPETGAELLEHAARLTPARSADARHDRLLSAARLRRQAGQASRARELIEPLLPELGEGVAAARALLVLALVRTDDGAVARRLFEQAERQAGSDHQLRAEIQVELAVHVGDRGHFVLSMEHAGRALESAELANDPLLRAQAIATHAGAAVFLGEEVDLERLRQATEFEDHTRLATADSPTSSFAQILLWTDDYEAARPAHERAIWLAKERGQLYTTGFQLLELAFLEWHAGNRELAASYQSESEQLLRGQGDHSLDLVLDWVEAIFAAGRGEFEASRTRALPALATAEDAGELLMVGGLAMVLGRIDLWTGNAGSAHERLQPVREAFTGAGFGLLCEVTIDMWAVDIEALLACGSIDEASALAQDLFDRARATTNPNALAIAERCRGQVLGAQGQTGTAIEALENALAAHAQRPLAPEIAHTLLELGALQRRAKQKNAAKQSLERALEMYSAIGDPIWEERARDQLARVGLRRPVVTEGLTPAQQRVAELVATGMSNREIANTLVHERPERRSPPHKDLPRTRGPLPSPTCFEANCGTCTRGPQT